MKAIHSFLRKSTVAGQWSILISALLLAIAASSSQAQQAPTMGGGGGSSPWVFIQYKATEADGYKCGYREFTNQDLPRIHVYHQQTIVMNYDHEFSDVGTKGYGNYPDCVSSTYSDGPYTNGTSSKLNNFTHHQFIKGTNCVYSETYSGDVYSSSGDLDARTYSYLNNCITCDWGVTNTDTSTIDDSNPQFVFIPSDGTNEWSMVGTTISFSYYMGGYGTGNGPPDGCGGVCPTGTCSNYVVTPYTNTPITIQFPADTYLAVQTPTHQEWDLLDPDNATGTDIAGGTTTSTETGNYTVDLSDEYTDAELYSNIMSIMPDYPTNWYVPMGGYYDFWQTIAYSAIGGSHIDGGVRTGGNAVLRQMEYQFCVPGSKALTQYLVTWNIETWDPSTGTISSKPMRTIVYGTGDPLNPALSPIFTNAPPYWDESSDPNGGVVIVWLDDVGISQLSGWAGYYAPAGSGPFAFPGTDIGMGSSTGTAFDKGGFSARFSLGAMTNGFAVRPLQLAGAAPSLALATPAALDFDTNNPLLQIIQSGGQLRQVSAPQAFVDVVINSPFSYDLRFYAQSQVGSLVGGLYQLSGSPFVTWTISNPDSSTTTFNRLSITETRGSMVNTYLYTCISNSTASFKWVLDYPNNLREDECDDVFDPITDQYGDQTYLRYVTNIVRVPAGPTQYKSVQIYQSVDVSMQTNSGLGNLGFQGLIDHIIDPDNNPQTTTLSYYIENLVGEVKPLQLITYPGANWQKFNSYDNAGRPLDVLSAFGDSPQPPGYSYTFGPREDVYTYSPFSLNDDGTLWTNIPRQVEVILDGSSVSMSYAVATPGELDDLQMLNVNDPLYAPGDPVTVTKFYTTGNFVNRVQSVLRPDGTMSFYQYGYAADGTETNIVYTGQPNSGQTAIVDGTETIVVFGSVGQMISSTAIDIASGIVLSQDTYGNYDSLNRPQLVAHLDGTTDQKEYNCCDVDNTTDRDGVVTQYYYDAMKRRTASTRLGITTTNVLDAVGEVLQTTRIGSDLSPIVMSQSAYDLSGRPILEINALGGITQLIHATDATTGGHVEIAINPDGGTVTNFHFMDGALKESLGTAIHGVRYENSANYQGPTTAEIKLNPDGTDTTEAVTNFYDTLDRPYHTVYSDGSQSQSFYNIGSELVTNLDPDGIASLFQYNGKGELVYTAIDIDQSGTIDFGGVDRIAANVSDVTTDHGFNVNRIRSYVWPTSNSTASNLVSVAETSTDGLRSWQTVYRDSVTPVISSTVTVYAPAGIRYITNTAPDGSYSVTRFRNGRLMVASHFDSLNNLLGSALYRYDAHGRVFTMTDARDGTTAYSYNTADLVASVTTPPPQNGQSSELTSTYYNTSLEPTNVVAPDGGSVLTTYLPTGEPAETSGARTYPVAYTYDYAGRVKTLTTWTNFAGNSGTAVTTWNYDPYRGFLISKTYNGGIAGPVYTNTPGGRLASRTWARGITTSYGYNTAGDLATITYSDGVTPNVSNGYDRQGRLIQQASASMQINSAYNNADQVISESYSGGPLDGQAITNGYDAFLRRSALALSTQPSTFTQYGYDNASRLSTVTKGSYSESYAYIPNSPLVGQITYQSNSVTAMTTLKAYDFLDRLLSISNTPSPGGGLNFNYSYNSVDQRTSEANLDGSYWTYKYDNLGQVTNAVRSWRDGTLVAGQQFGYAFDTIGNRTLAQSGGDQYGQFLRVAPYANDLLNQIISRVVPGFADIKGVSIATNTVTVNGTTAYRKWEYFRDEVPVNNASAPQWTNITVSASGQNPTNGFEFVAKTPEAFLYDADGNLINDGRWSYVWDAENRLLSMTSLSSAPPGSMLKLDFAYDFQGRRLQKVVSTNSGSGYVPQYTNCFAYDGWNIVAILNPQSSLLQSFTWGLDLSGSLEGAGGAGGLLESTDYGATTTNSFPMFDGNGNVAGLINAADGTTLANYEYGPFGEPLRRNGSLAKENPMRFSTKYHDETGLLNYGHRYYNSSTGRWLDRDPIDEAGGPNLYGYVGNRPVSTTDPLGLSWWGRFSDASFGWLGNLIYVHPTNVRVQWDNQAFADRNEYRLIDQKRIDPNEFYDFSVLERDLVYKDSVLTKGDPGQIATVAWLMGDTTQGYLALEQELATGGIGEGTTALTASERTAVRETIEQTGTGIETEAAEEAENAAAMDGILLSQRRGVPMDPAEFKLVKEAWESGGEGRHIITDHPSAMADLDHIQRKYGLEHVEGLTMSENVIILRPDATKSGVLEELIHSRQIRVEGMNPETQGWLMEIRAKETLIKMKDAWHIPDQENLQTLQQLEWLKNHRPR